MSTAELKSNLLRIINTINDNSTLQEIYSFVSQKKGDTKDSLNMEKQDLNNLSASGLAKAYGDDEPDYSNTLLKNQIRNIANENRR
ncbi:MAG TPA: hypothetical protein VK808_00790 [Bacteroidia bacterium]|jgi:hypothetical protein|nr:hypothetical protein [Bacteroidia bacterium]